MGEKIKRRFGGTHKPHVCQMVNRVLTSPPLYYGIDDAAGGAAVD